MQSEYILFNNYKLVVNILSTIENKIHIDRIISFACGRIFDNEHTWRLLENILLAALCNNGEKNLLQEYTANRMINCIRANIVSAIDGESSFADTFQNQLLHNFRLLETFFCIKGDILLEHEETIIQLLTSVYTLQFDRHFKHTDLLTNTLLELFNTLGTVFMSSKPHIFFNLSEGVNSYQFPLLLLPEDISARWHLPSQSEIRFVRRLLQSFIYPQIKFLQQYAASKSNEHENQQFSPAQLEKSVALLMSIEGLESPFFKMSPLVDDIM